MKVHDRLQYVETQHSKALLQTRLIVVAIVLLLAILTNSFANPPWIIWTVAAYVAALIVVMGVLKLRVVRERVLPDLLDLIAISVLVRATGEADSVWFLLYAFPLLSAARYLGTVGNLTFTGLMALSYLFFGNAFHVSPGGAFSVVLLRIVLLGGVSLTATNLARSKRRADAALVRTIEKINREILGTGDLQQVIRFVLVAAMEVTNSDLSVLLLDDENQLSCFGSSAEGDVAVAEREGDVAVAEQLVRGNYQAILARAEANYEGGMEIPGSPWSARLVPLRLEGIPFGALGVFCRGNWHYYTADELRTLSIMGPLVAMAQKNAKSYREHNARENDHKNRLQMLYKIGGKLKTEQGLDLLFQQVVKLVSTHLSSEEAALFLHQGPSGELKKVAVTGPNDATTAKLWEVERLYEGVASLTSQVFGDKVPKLLPHIPPSEPHAAEYARLLPSGTASHYMGVPLIIGDEVLGVIRVLNKKAPTYETDASLAPNGFRTDELDLLTMIATQIASAIRSAKFIDQNNSFRNLVYNSPDPIIVLDRDGKILNFNRECERIWGWKEAEIVGTPVERYYKSRAHAARIGFELKEAPDNTIRDFRAEIRHKDGTMIPILLSASMFVDAQGQRLGSIGVFKDEREMLRKEQERLSAEKLTALGKFAQTLGHDVKTDLAIVLNYVEILSSRDRPPADTKAIDTIRKFTLEAIKKLQGITMAVKPMRPQIQVISLASVLSNLESGAHGIAVAMKIEFCSKLPGHEVLLRADPEQLRQVFSNLLANSIHAIELARAHGSRDRGRIGLTATAEEDAVKLIWQDDGDGLPDEVRDRAFAPFFTTKETGSGLGLFITKTIVENHGGTISIEPSAGSGARFVIRLPLRGSPAESRQEVLH